MEISKYRREELDYSKIRQQSLLERTNFPKKIPVVEGHSTCYQVSPDWFFKRKQQDGNYYLNNNSVHSMHHFIYEEIVGSFDDLAEVLCYQLAKNMGTRIKTTNSGEQITVPLIDCTEYRLATYTNENEEVQRGCISRNVAKPGERLIKGIDLLGYLSEDKFASTCDNTLPNYIKALKHLASSRDIVVDRNLPQDLIINSYFCWKVANCDNHSNNIFLTQYRQEDGSWAIKIGTMIDNGSAWELSVPYYTFKADGSMYCRYREIYNKVTGNDSIEAHQVEDVNFEDNPFYAHNAFRIDAGNLNGHSKILDGRKLDYEYDLAAYALQYPEIYQAIYQIEQEFDIERAFYEVGAQYNLKWPDFMKETIRATTEYKSNLIQRVMADYFCHTAYTSCVADIQGEDDILYNMFKEEFQNLPLQPDLNGYVGNFRNFAEMHNIPIDVEKLYNLPFLPKKEQKVEQLEDPTTLHTQSTPEGGPTNVIC